MEGKALARQKSDAFQNVTPGQLWRIGNCAVFWQYQRKSVRNSDSSPNLSKPFNIGDLWYVMTCRKTLNLFATSLFCVSISDTLAGWNIDTKWHTGKAQKTCVHAGVSRQMVIYELGIDRRVYSITVFHSSDPLFFVYQFLTLTVAHFSWKPTSTTVRELVWNLQ